MLESKKKWTESVCGLPTIANTAIGIIINKMAFSWTCQPNINEQKLHKIRALKKCTWLPRWNHNFHRIGNWAKRVKTNGITGGTLGSVQWIVSVTKPLVEAPPSQLCNSIPIFFWQKLNNLSVKLYRAQKLGAQYAWVSPLLKGNSRWNKTNFWLKNGPTESPKVVNTIRANLKSLQKENPKKGESWLRQDDKRYMK